jgi:hypothetical protein
VRETLKLQGIIDSQDLLLFRGCLRQDDIQP